MRLIPHPSPNFGVRRGGVLPDLVVLHYTAMDSCAVALERLCDPGAEVSAHYLVAETGEVFALVDEAERAWHAGAGSWGAVDDVNSRSIGIELANPGTAPFAAAQMSALEDLLASVMARWSIPPERVIAHSDMAPGRKADPGRHFDWRRLALQGLSVWPVSPAGIAPETAAFDDMLTAFGYPAVGTDLRLLALRLRFRPWATGPLDALDLGMACDLARRFPVDGGRSGA